MKKYFIYILIVPLLLLTSCEKWLQIDPEDRIMEENLFNNKEGFMTALNGVYIEMSSNTLYGGIMQATVIDAMAQYYSAIIVDEVDNHPYSYYAKFEYTQSNVKSTFGGVWTKYYNLIINCNTIIEHCDKSKGMLGEQYYNVIKGEALALRAFFHSEVLRVWGPTFKSNKDMECMPYAVSPKIEIYPLLAATDIYGKIKQDLLAAESYLEKSDPIVTDGILFSPGSLNNDMRYRNLRLNYYAVQALLARVALFCDDQPTALEYAKKVVGKVQQEGHELFPFVDRTSAGNTADRVYQSELLFAQYNVKRGDIFKSYFSNSLADANVLRLADEQVDGMYEETDYRVKYQWEKLTSPTNKEQYYFVKYKQVDLVSNASNAVIQKNEFRYLVPMIRISEMYLILAECEPDPTLSMDYLNTLRSARGLKKLSNTSQIADEIEKEYKKEFIGEGQLFFYYKRIGKEEIVYGDNWGQSIEMGSAQYVVPLPDGEINNRVSNN